jgi:hypothetical protein
MHFTSGDVFVKRQLWFSIAGLIVLSGSAQGAAFVTLKGQLDSRNEREFQIRTPRRVYTLFVQGLTDLQKQRLERLGEVVVLTVPAENIKNVNLVSLPGLPSARR